MWWYYYFFIFVGVLTKKRNNMKNRYFWQQWNKYVVKSYVADLLQSTVSSTSGLLVEGVEYVILSLNVGDNFLNVGYVSVGTPFFATGTTPTVWSNGTVVIDTKLSAPVGTELANTTEMYFTYSYIDEGVYFVTSSKDLFTTPYGQRVQASISNATYIEDVSGPTGHSAVIIPVADNRMVILTTDLSAFTDDILGNYTQNALEILIYPQV